MNLSYIESKSLDPYYNLALEKYLFDTVKSDELILYLWQNEKTVVCGRNQNVYKECATHEIETNGVHIARRLSGGGTVFHDIGNLNFTFISQDGNYNLDNQMRVILDACRSFDIPVTLNGRNDITVDGKKISGNAFYKSKGRKYHHGTLMVNVDFSLLSKFLNVDRKKLVSKGVDSVRARVENLSTYSTEITISALKQALKNSFQKEYGAPCFEKSISGINLEERIAFFSSNEFIYGKITNFENTISERFSWGDFELCCNVKSGIITDSRIYSDALYDSFINEISKNIVGCIYDAKSLIEVIDKIDIPDEVIRKSIKDLITSSI